jgi:hypothetical protein
MTETTYPIAAVVAERLHAHLRRHRDATKDMGAPKGPASLPYPS